MANQPEMKITARLDEEELAKLIKLYAESKGYKVTGDVRFKSRSEYVGTTGLTKEVFDCAEFEMKARDENVRRKIKRNNDTQPIKNPFSTTEG